MIVLKSNDSTNLSFDMGIEGNATTVNKVCLVLETNKGFDIRIPAEYTNGSVTATVPVLETVLDSGEYTMSLEVQIDGKVYTPLQESVTIETPISVKAKIAESTEVVPEIKEEPKFNFKGISKAILDESSNN